MIYLDNAATTFPKPEEVYAAMDSMNRFSSVNAGRGSYKMAREASALILETKSLLRKLVHVDASSSVVFSPSATIAMNQIVFGLSMRNNSVVYLSPFEHNAVARSVYKLKEIKNIIIKELPLTSGVEIDIEKMKYEFAKDKPSAVFCTHISNVTGYILPVDEIFEEAKKYNSFTVLDTAQSLGLIELNAPHIDVDFIVFAGHKNLYGPFGVGGFINVKNIELQTFICGGTGSDSLNLEMPVDSEGRFEAGSSNILAIAGLNAALKLLNVNENYVHEKELTEYLIGELLKLSNIKIYSPNDVAKRVGIVSFNVVNFTSEDIGLILDEDYNIAVRTGYHCAPFVHKYLEDKTNLGTVRIGLSQFNSEEEVSRLIIALKEIMYES